MDYAEIQEISRWIYKNFEERNYTKYAITRQKEAFTNVLVPYTGKRINKYPRSSSICRCGDNIEVE